MPDLLNIPGFTKKRVTGACIVGSFISLALYGVLQVCDGWRYTPEVFVAVFLLGIGSFSVWAIWFSDE